MASSLPGVVPIALSAALHGGIVLVAVGLLSVGWFSRGPYPSSTAPAAIAIPSDRTIDIELPPFRSDDTPKPASSALSTPTPTHVSNLPGGSDIPRPDTGHHGRGGTDRASQPGVNLADHDQHIRLVRSVASHIDRDQIPRILSAAIRQSWENQRLTTQPMELTFLASGQGTRQERRPPATRDPSAGTPTSSPRCAKGAERQGAPAMPEGVGYRVADVGGDVLGSDRESIGLGVDNTLAGQDHRLSAAVAHARPSVDKGSPSIPAPYAGSPKDNVDAAQQIAMTHQSLTDASTAGGLWGDGPGGQKGLGPTGYGGLQGPGSRSKPLGYGSGSYGWNGQDPRLSLYRRQVMAKIWPYWGDAFPHWAKAEMRQGRVIIAVTILPDGSLRTAQVLRPSGIDEFDANCMKAVHRAAPFDPFPKNFPLAVLHWELSFDASNPLVR